MTWQKTKLLWMSCFRQFSLPKEPPLPCLLRVRRNLHHIDTTSPITHQLRLVQLFCSSPFACPVCTPPLLHLRLIFLSGQVAVVALWHIPNTSSCFWRSISDQRPQRRIVSPSPAQWVCICMNSHFWTCVNSLFVVWSHTIPPIVWIHTLDIVWIHPFSLWAHPLQRFLYSHILVWFHTLHFVWIHTVLSELTYPWYVWTHIILCDLTHDCFCEFSQFILSEFTHIWYVWTHIFLCDLTHDSLCEFSRFLCDFTHLKSVNSHTKIAAKWGPTL